MEKYFTVFEKNDNTAVEGILEIAGWDPDGLTEGRYHLRDGSVVMPGQMLHYKDIISCEDDSGLPEILPEDIPATIVF